ncbi:MAG: ABC transporter permease, partial [Mycobacteriales bacterium]
KNLSNIFITPMSTTEYILANCLLALLRAVLVFAVVAVAAALVFGFNVLSIGIVTFVLAFAILTVFAWGIGWLLLGFVFRYGTGIQAVTWGAVYFFQPLTAAFFPVSVLPGPLQAVAYAFPPTYAFEASRHAATAGGVDWHLLLPGLLLDGLWFAAGVVSFNRLFRRSRVIGQFARNDS